MGDQEKKSTTPYVCKHCGANLEIQSMSDIAYCPYCGTAYSPSDLLNESDTIKAERIRAQSVLEVETARIKEAAEKEKREESKSEEENFKKSKFGKFLIVCAILCAVVTVLIFLIRFSFAGVISLLQTGMFATAWISGAGILKKIKKGVRVLITIGAFVLILPFVLSCRASACAPKETKPEKFDWADIELSEELPKPQKTYGEIDHNTRTAAILTLCDVTEKGFRAYRDECMESGYTIESDEAQHAYAAYNREGFHLRLVYSESQEEMTVFIDAPEELGVLIWPQRGLGSMLPKPVSEVGDITEDSTGAFAVRVGDTPIDAYREYVRACEAAGFVEEYAREDKSFSAQDETGYRLCLEYIGFDRMDVELKAPETPAPIVTDAPETEEPETTAPSEIPTEVPTAVPTAVPTEVPTEEVFEEMINGMRASFKDAMDSYEEFIDEYCAFMKKYMATDGNDPTLLLNYFEMIAELAEMEKAFAEWGEEELNDTEMAYYLQVQTRVTKKLWEIAQQEKIG